MNLSTLSTIAEFSIYKGLHKRSDLCSIINLSDASATLFPRCKWLMSHKPLVRAFMLTMLIVMAEKTCIYIHSLWSVAVCKITYLQDARMLDFMKG